MDKGEKEEKTCGELILGRYLEQCSLRRIVVLLLSWEGVRLRWGVKQPLEQGGLGHGDRGGEWGRRVVVSPSSSWFVAGGRYSQDGVWMISASLRFAPLCTLAWPTGPGRPDHSP